MQRIVCAVDSSPASRPLVVWAANFAQRLQAGLCLFHAVHTAADGLHPTTEFERGGELRRRRQNALEQLEMVMAPFDLAWRVEVPFGEPAEMLARFCRDHPVDLVISGSRGVKGFKRFLFGTVVERMVRMVGCPLLALRPDTGPAVSIKTIGVCCDLSGQTAALAKPALALAHAFSAEVALLHSMASALTVTEDEPMDTSYTRAQQDQRLRLQKQFADAVAEQNRKKVPVRAHVGAGAPQDLIPELARSLHTDILVVGVRHHSAIGKWMIGSATEAVLRRANCHVLTVPL